MTTKQTLVAALFFSGVSLFAGKPFSIKNDRGNEFLSTKPQLTFRKTADQKSPFNIVNKTSFSGKEWDESEVSGGGFFINFGVHFMSKSFLNPEYESGDPRFKTGFDFEFGNFFRFAKVNEDRVGIGMRATWLSLSYAKMKDEKDIYRAAQIRLVHLGPQVAIAIDDKMGVDVFYQVGFNLTNNFGSIDSPGNNKTIGASSTYMGVSQEFGAAFHYKVFSLGLGYRFGALKNTLNVYDGETLDSDFLDDKKNSVNNFRVTLGFKF